MDQSERIIQALNEIRDEVRTLRDDQAKQQQTSLQHQRDLSESTLRYYETTLKRASKSAASTWLAVFVMLTLLLASALLTLLWNR